MPNPPKLSKEVFDFEFSRIREMIEPHFSAFFSGYRVPRGWMFIVERLHKELVSLYPDYQVEQVKEKYGTLRFYVEYPPDAELQAKIDVILLKYEDESAITCQECGSSSATTQEDKGWLFTICDNCYNSMGRKFLGLK